MGIKFILDSLLISARGPQISWAARAWATLYHTAFMTNS